MCHFCEIDALACWKGHYVVTVMCHDVECGAYCHFMSLSYPITYVEYAACSVAGLTLGL